MRQDWKSKKIIQLKSSQSSLQKHPLEQKALLNGGVKNKLIILFK